MNPLKWLWTMLQIAVMSLGLVGCISILTAPITGLPLFIITISILILAPPAGHRLRSWWETLTIVLLVQTALFSFMLIATSMSQVERVATRLHNQYERLRHLTEAQKRQRIFSGTFKEMKQGGTYILLSLLLPAFGVGILYLWRHGYQTLALWLQLPCVLGLAAIFLIFLVTKKK